jgi:hypothetical protein
MRNLLARNDEVIEVFVVVENFSDGSHIKELLGDGIRDSKRSW